MTTSKVVRAVLFAFVLTSSLITLTACNTTKGAGKDMENAGEVFARIKPDFDPLIVGFKRASRIVEKEQWEPGPVDPDRFQEPAEGDLHRRIGVCRADVHREMAGGRYDKALEALVGLKPAIDAFFTNVMVNVEDASLRGNRLSLLKDVKECFTSFADFSRIVVQGT